MSANKWFEKIYLISSTDSDVEDEDIYLLKTK